MPFSAITIGGRSGTCSSGEQVRPRAGLALEAVGIPVYENNVDAAREGRPSRSGSPGSATSGRSGRRDDEYDEFVRGGKMGYTGVDDLPGTLKQVTDDAPVILMAHEPDIFPKVPDRVSLTLVRPYARRPNSHFRLCAGGAVAVRFALRLWAQDRRRHGT